MKFNVFHYLLYSKRMNTLNKDSWSKCFKKEKERKAGMFVKEELFHQGTRILMLEDEEETLPRTMKTSQTFTRPGFTVRPLPNTHVTPVQQQQQQQYEKYK